MFNRKLLSLLISLLLALSPFASLDVAAAIAGKGHCMVMDADDNHSVAGKISYSEDDHAMRDCAHCQDDSCNDNSCASQGCSTGSLSLINVKELAIPGYLPLRQFSSLDTDLFSHTSPPLLRPPV